MNSYIPPFGLRPIGNYFINLKDNENSPNSRNSLGPQFQSFSDEQFLSLLYYFSPSDLHSLLLVNRYFYVFIQTEEIWRDCVLNEWGGNFQFHENWRISYEYNKRLKLLYKQNKNSNTNSNNNSDNNPIINSHSNSNSLLFIDSIVNQIQMNRENLLFPIYSDYLFSLWQSVEWNFNKLLDNHNNEDDNDNEEENNNNSNNNNNNHNNSVNVHDNIIRLDASSLSVNEFINKIGILNRPVILTNIVNKWPGTGQKAKTQNNTTTTNNNESDNPTPTDSREWNYNGLLSRFGSNLFKVGKYSMTMKDYLLYAQQSNDEIPLYLFDSSFGERFPSLLEDYQIPKYFELDHFSLLSSISAPRDFNDGCEDRTEECFKDEREQQEFPVPDTMRPAFRWILIGPKRSGSTWHKDPNLSSAWNGLMFGRKKWIFYPPSMTPPGIRTSPDLAEVATPISVIEWFRHFYEEHREIIKKFHYQNGGNRASKQFQHLNYFNNSDEPIDIETPNITDYSNYGPIEAVCGAGELIFIPCGWWHTALNLEFSIAATQNYINHQNLLDSLKFIYDDQNLILYQNFYSIIQKNYPYLLEKLNEKRKLEIIKNKNHTDNNNNTADIANMNETNSSAENSNKRKSLWENMRSGAGMVKFSFLDQSNSNEENSIESEENKEIHSDMPFNSSKLLKIE